ncbi:serine hydroxymethyltransferase [Streptomyces canus]|uniref:serine hydroxymethyltransferase n=1 Tax=Streptomyces canus TaxID=58343 RepID=UPI0036748BAB
MQSLAATGIDLLRADDPELHRMLTDELRRQEESLVMVASSSVADPTVLACQGSSIVNVTAEGYPGRRYHAGCCHVDEVEQLAIDRAKELFGAFYANVQPHSASVANELVLTSLLRPGDTILGMDLHQGGHLTHGSPASLSGRLFTAHGYGLDASGLIDYDQVLAMARELRPKLIICGATAYARTVDFARFREIADEVGALLLADISHIAGLVVAGLHPSPVPHAHITTTCTHKQLYGPRGGLILMGPDAEALAPDGRHTLAQLMQRSVFPHFQGAPAVNAIAAKARAFAWCASEEFTEVAKRILGNARALAAAFDERGYRVISGGTDNHIVLLDLTDRGLTGRIAEQALESVGIIVNKNHIPGDKRSSTVTSGLRLGTNTLAVRGLEPADMARCAELADRVLSRVRPLDDRTFLLDEVVRQEVADHVARFARNFPISRYPVTGAAPAGSFQGA